MALPDLLRSAARLGGEREAVRLGDEALTYDQLYERSSRLAQVLAAAGLRPGDRVSSLGRNRLESVEEITGVALGGFVRSPLYLHNSTSAHVYMIQRVGSRALIVDADSWPALEQALAEAGHALEVVLVRGGSAAGISTGGNVADYDTALAGAPAEDPGVEIDEREIHIIRFSAGTTGMPKPIAVSWRNWRLMGEEMLLVTDGFGPEDTELVISPYSHGSGNLAWPMISSRARQLIMPKFDPADALELIERHRCSVTFLVPTMIRLLVEHPDARRRDLSSLHTVFYGAAPLSEHTLKKAIEVWGNGMYQLYGQSEVVPVAVLGPEHHLLGKEPSKLGTAGRATPNSAMRIEGPDGEVLGPGETGQVVVTAPGQMIGIYGDDEATAARVTEDGWIRTGDVGQIDEDGFLRLMDRMEDVIISGGFNIWPAEIEKALVGYPGVREAVVFGVPHPKWGETPVAVVHADPAAPMTEEDLIAHCRTELGSVKKPTSVHFSQEPLPKNSAGKLLRRDVRRDYTREGAPS